MRVLFSFFLFFIFSCNPKKNHNQKEMYGIRYASGGETTSFYNQKNLEEVNLEEQNCAHGLSDLGKVKIHLIDRTTNKPSGATKKYKDAISLQEIDLTGVKGNPVSSDFINSVLILQHKRDVKEGCVEEKIGTRSAMKCDSYKEELVSPGREAHICKKEYGENSLENHVLAAVASVQKTLECYESFFPQNVSRPKIDLVVFPKNELVFNMKDGKKKITYKTDNAYHTSSVGLNTLPQIVFFPNSKHTDFFSPVTLNLGIGSHETGHYIFMLYTGLAQNLVNFQAGLSNHLNYTIMTHDKDTVSNKREVSSRMVFGAINEGLADAVATLCFLEKPYSSLAFSKEEAVIRDSSKDKMKYKEISKDTETINIKVANTGTVTDEIPKKLNEDRLRHFFSQNKTKTIKGRDDREIDDKDEHHIGAIVTYGLFQFWKALSPTDSKYDFLSDAWSKKSVEDKEKYLKELRKMLIESIYHAGQVIPNKEPSVYLDDVIFSLLKGGMKKDNAGRLSVSDKVCDVLKKQFPINYIGFQNNFECT